MIKNINKSKPILWHRQVSRMSTEGEAAPAAESPAEGEPLPEVVVIVIINFNNNIIVIVIIIIVSIMIIIFSSSFK